MSVLRTLAVMIAIAGLVDPSFQMSREAPVPVLLLSAPGDWRAAAVASTLREALAGRVELVEAGESAAAVAIGAVAPEALLRADGPVSVVSLDRSPVVTIVKLPSSIDLIPGTAIDLPVVVEASGLTGRSSAIVVEQDDVEVGRVTHEWKADGRATVMVPYVAASAGARRITVRVEAAAGERRVEDSRADLLATVAPRPARVAVIEPRPSWAGTFTRRVLENDPAFRVSSILRTSRGIVSRAGEALPAVTAEHLERFDVLIVGSPEDLQASEVEAAWQFAERRGGTVVLLPDRMPSGAYAARLPGRLAEHLLTEPKALEPSSMLASEVLAMTSLPPGARALAALDEQPVVLSWPVGDGLILFSGALDAWRYRGHEKSRLSAFWREEILSAAVAAPPPVEIEVTPSVLRPGDTARVAVRLRRTEWLETRGGKGSVHLPAVEAHLIDPSGRIEMIRLWPEAETGLFRGEAPVAVLGVHTLRVVTERHAAEVALLADAAASQPRASREVTGDLPALTGGTTVSASRLDPLVQHLSSLPRASTATREHPFRAEWWAWIFAGLLCGEWALRRRAGLR